MLVGPLHPQAQGLSLQSLLHSEDECFTRGPGQMQGSAGHIPAPPAWDHLDRLWARSGAVAVTLCTGGPGGSPVLLPTGQLQGLCSWTVQADGHARAFAAHWQVPQTRTNRRGPVTRVACHGSLLTIVHVCADGAVLSLPLLLPCRAPVGPPPSWGSTPHPCSPPVALQPRVWGEAVPTAWAPGKVQSRTSWGHGSLPARASRGPCYMQSETPACEARGHSEVGMWR